MEVQGRLDSYLQIYPIFQLKSLLEVQMSSKNVWILPQERTTRPHLKESTGSSAQTELEMGGDTLRLPGASMRRNTSSSSSMMKRGRNNTTLLNVKSILTDRRNKVYS